jgi:predicted RNA-binding protein YlxR (DUF448 family)
MAPVRRCAGCGRRAPKADLLRFVAADGILKPAAPRDQGRGAYTCRRLVCFERAVTRGGFSRSLHSSVKIDPELVRLYTDANG